MTLRVYVAGSSGELERVEAVIARLREAGATITLDWTLDVRAHRAAGHATDADLSDEEARFLAETDRDAVVAADVFLLLAPVVATRGAWVELGIATTFCGYTAVAGHAARDSIFTRLVDEVFSTDADAIDTIAEMV